jgi:hypothetical protein
MHAGKALPGPVPPERLQQAVKGCLRPAGHSTADWEVAAPRPKHRSSKSFKNRRGFGNKKLAPPPKYNLLIMWPPTLPPCMAPSHARSKHSAACRAGPRLVHQLLQLPRRLGAALGQPRCRRLGRLPQPQGPGLLRSGADFCGAAALGKHQHGLGGAQLAQLQRAKRPGHVSMQPQALAALAGHLQPAQRPPQ